MKKILLFTFGLFFLLLLILLFISPLNFFKDDIQKAVKQETGLDLDIKGDINFQLIKPDQLSIHNIELKKNKIQLLSLKEISINWSLWELFRKKIIIQSIEIKSPQIHLSKNFLEHLKPPTQKEGKKTDKRKEILKEFSIQKLSLTEINASYENILISKANIKVQNFKLKNFEDILSQINPHIQVNLQKLVIPPYKVNDLRLDTELKDKNFNINKFEGKVYEQFFYGNLSYHLEGPASSNQLTLSIEKLSMEKVKPIQEASTFPLSGDLSFSSKIRFNDLQEFSLKTLEGQVIIQGENLKVKNIDIDKLVNSYRDSQKVTLLDTLGFYTLGPLGVLASQGVNIGKSIPGVYKGESHIKNLVIDILLNEGVAHLKDVAVQTPGNFIAAKGRLNFNKNSFERVKVGFLNEKFCAELTQKIIGKLDNPEFELGKSLLKTIVAPLTSVIKSSKEFLMGCEPFYQGSLARNYGQ